VSRPVYNSIGKQPTPIRIAVAGLFIGVVHVLAQTSAQRPLFPNSGTAVIQVTPTVSPTSLLHLIRASSLIVDGTVNSLLPVIDTRHDPDAAPNLETHAVVAVNAVLSGAVPNSSANILIAQSGGQMGNWNFSVAGDPLVSPGERYILFLIPDVRPELPNTSGMPRFAVTGVWTGKAKVTNGKVSFAAAAGPKFKPYNGLSLGSFLQTLKAAISRPYTDADTRLPVNLAPAP
jgi:hypothetical protein